MGRVCRFWTVKAGSFGSSALVALLLNSGVMPARAQQPMFNPRRYNPAVLYVRFTSAEGRTASSQADAFLDVTLISASGAVEGVRTEVVTAEFRDQLFRLYRQLSRLESLHVHDPSSPSRRLHEMIFGGLLEIFKREKISTFLISADLGLQAVPFAALSDGDRFFGDRFAFAITPSLALVDFDVSEKTQGRLLALGASRFKGLADLPLVPQEIRRIDSSRDKDLFLDQDFTQDALLIKGGEPRYDRLHVATHAEFRSGGPDNSELHSGIGPISMKELSRLRLKRRGAPLDLVVFSACRTALGDADAELGFSGLALQAGARSAVGTLWYVDDVATSAYFILMYRYLKQGVPKADAMQLTRQAFVRGNVRLLDDQLLGPDGRPLLIDLTSEQQRRVRNGLANPFYWAGISLMGSPL